MISELQALRYAGVMGHEFVVLRNFTHPENERIGWRTGAECNTLEQAEKFAGEFAGETAIYKRSGDGWEKVARSATCRQAKSKGVRD